MVKMSDGPRKRGASGGDPQPEPAAKDPGGGGGGVALKKEIGLVSACGIIVGKFFLKSAVSTSVPVYYTVHCSLLLSPLLPHCLRVQPGELTLTTL